MKFKFLGKPNILASTLTTGKSYEILQFEQCRGHLAVYIIDDNGEVLRVIYRSTSTFNELWKYEGQCKCKQNVVENV